MKKFIVVLLVVLVAQLSTTVAQGWVESESGARVNCEAINLLSGQLGEFALYEVNEKTYTFADTMRQTFPVCFPEGGLSQDITSPGRYHFDNLCTVTSEISAGNITAVGIVFSRTYVQADDIKYTLYNKDMEEIPPLGERTRDAHERKYFSLYSPGASQELFITWEHKGETSRASLHFDVTASELFIASISC